jgi:hypothetical protein
MEEYEGISLSKSTYFQEIANELIASIDIVEGVSDNAFSRGGTRIIGKTAVLETVQSFKSALDNLRGMKLVIERNNFRCAFELLRCYRDAIFQSLFLMHNLESTRFEEYINQDASIKNEKITLENMTHFLDYCLHKYGEYQKQKSRKDKAIDEWENGDYSKEESCFAFGYKTYRDDLLTDSKIKEMDSLFFCAKLKALDTKLNDYIHNNNSKIKESTFFETAKELQAQSEDLLADIRLINVFFLSAATLLDSTWLESSDYSDQLEMGLTPKEGDQYLVMPVISLYLAQWCPDDLLDFIKKNDRYQMKI